MKAVSPAKQRIIFLWIGLIEDRQARVINRANLGGSGYVKFECLFLQKLLAATGRLERRVAFADAVVGVIRGSESDANR